MSQDRPERTSVDDQVPDIDGFLQQLNAFLGDEGGPGSLDRPGWKPSRTPVTAVMTRDVVWVPASASYRQVAVTMAEHRLGAVPVLDDATVVVGVISEGDLLAKLALVHDPGAPPHRRETSAQTRRKARAEDARQLMTCPAVTVRDTDSVVDAARVAAKHGLRRLPVVGPTGRLVGIVTRSDLLRAFRTDDEAIRRYVQQTTLREEFCLPPGTVRVEVADGVVRLSGQVERAAVIPTLVAAVSAISGVVAVRDHLSSVHGQGE